MPTRPIATDAAAPAGAAACLQRWSCPALLLGAGLLLAGCSQPAQPHSHPEPANPPRSGTPDGQPVVQRFEGMLLLKGSAPHVTGTLRTDAGEEWLLQGVANDTLQRLQRQRVVVTGTVRPAQPGWFGPRVLQVQQLDPAPALR